MVIMASTLNDILLFADISEYICHSQGTPNPVKILTFASNLLNIYDAFKTESERIQSFKSG